MHVVLSIFFGYFHWKFVERKSIWISIFFKLLFSTVVFDKNSHFFHFQVPRLCLYVFYVFTIPKNLKTFLFFSETENVIKWEKEETIFSTIVLQDFNMIKNTQFQLSFHMDEGVELIKFSSFSLFKSMLK